MTDFELLRKRLIATELPTGKMKVPRYESWISAECFASERPETDELHLTWILVGALRDMGLTYQELFELAEVTVEDGTLYGGVQIENHAPLRENVEYEIDARILDLERKKGARLGVFDLLTFELRIRLHEQVMASATSTFILGRGEA